MRSLLLSLFLVSATLPAADTLNLTGKWQVQRSAAGRESKLECTFTQKDAELTGSCATERGTVSLKGKVEGKNVSWTYVSESEGGTVTVVHKGTAESPSKIAGTLTAVEFGIDGEFTATLVK